MRIVAVVIMGVFLGACDGHLIGGEGLRPSHGGGGNLFASRSMARVGPNRYVARCGDRRGCIESASDTCPYGHHVFGDEVVSTGAVAHTSAIGNNSFTTVRNTYATIYTFTCDKPTFCTSQAQCEASGLRCVHSQRFPGRTVCADR